MWLALVLLTSMAVACFVSGLAPKITEGEKNLVIGAMLENLEVVDADILQSERRMTLTLVVREATTAQRAKEIGEGFIRLTKSLGPDDSPTIDAGGEEIGDGIFDYVISIFYPSGEAVASGAKTQSSSNIDW